MRGLKDIDYVLAKLAFMRAERIWPNGLRYLWTDAFGLVLLVSLYEELKEERFLDEAEWLVAEVDARARAASAAFASARRPTATANISTISPCGSMRLPCSGASSRNIASAGIALARDIHRPFVVPGAA